MSNNTASLNKQIESAGELQGIVRSMKALAASSITQYERSVTALEGYYRTVELGLRACFGGADPGPDPHDAPPAQPQVTAVVFGSDQGLVGSFNDVVAGFAAAGVRKLSPPIQVWTVGERVHGALVAEGLTPGHLLKVPESVEGITSLVAQVLDLTQSATDRRQTTELHLFYNSPQVGAGYEPVTQRVLPLDSHWRQNLETLAWPTKMVPEVIGDPTETLRGFLQGYLFISLFRACAESLASENASRLAAMERADKNIEELLEGLHTTFHRLRQGGIDEELFDVIAGFEALV